MSSLFTMKGRVSRREYIIVSLVITVISYAFVAAIGWVSAVSDGEAHNAGVFGLIVFLVSCLAQSVYAVRRLHDLGRSGWHFWLVLLPFYNIYFLLLLSFTRGSNSANEYGPAPV